jgi:MFS family permease
VVTLSTFAAMLAQFPAGKLADKIGRKKALSCLTFFIAWEFLR